MTVDAIQNGIVIDHITAGRAMRLYELLNLGKQDIPVAIMLNVPSRKMGRKDIIKIDAKLPVDFDVIGYVDPEATVNVIKEGVTTKYTMGLPEKLTNVLHCKNPRCITTCEQELPQIFRLTDREKKVYRCIYCETMASV